jgi:hypothetical protein
MIVGTAMVKGSIEARGLMNTFGVFDVVATRKLYEFSRLAERVKAGRLLTHLKLKQVHEI